MHSVTFVAYTKDTGSYHHVTVGYKQSAESWKFGILSSLTPPFCGTLAAMGSKDKGRKEAKKAPKPKPKPEPAQRREGFTPAPPPK